MSPRNLFFFPGICNVMLISPSFASLLILLTKNRSKENFPQLPNFISFPARDQYKAGFMQIRNGTPSAFMLSYGVDEDSPFAHIAPALLCFSSQLNRIKSEILLITFNVQRGVRSSASLQESIRIFFLKNL